MSMLQGAELHLGQFNEMMAAAEVSFESRGGFQLGNDMRRAVLRCIFCRHADTCRAWLDAKGRKSRPDFCPNLPFLVRYGSSNGAAASWIDE